MKLTSACSKFPPPSPSDAKQSIPAVSSSSHRGGGGGREEEMAFEDRLQAKLTGGRGPDGLDASAWGERSTSNGATAVDGFEDRLKSKLASSVDDPAPGTAPFQSDSTGARDRFEDRLKDKLSSSAERSGQKTEGTSEDHVGALVGATADVADDAPRDCDAAPGHAAPGRSTFVARFEDLMSRKVAAAAPKSKRGPGAGGGGVRPVALPPGDEVAEAPAPKPSEPALIEAYLVEEGGSDEGDEPSEYVSAVAVRPTPWWKTRLAIGAASVVATAGAAAAIVSVTLIPTAQPPPAVESETAASTRLFYADFQNEFCNDDILKRPAAFLGRALYVSVEECCKREFSLFGDYDECMAKSTDSSHQPSSVSSLVPSQSLSLLPSFAPSTYEKRTQSPPADPTGTASREDSPTNFVDGPLGWTEGVNSEIPIASPTTAPSEPPTGTPVASPSELPTGRATTSPTEVPSGELTTMKGSCQTGPCGCSTFPTISGIPSYCNNFTPERDHHCDKCCLAAD